jgi:hypothetical protein
MSPGPHYLCEYKHNACDIVVAIIKLSDAQARDHRESRDPRRPNFQGLYRREQVDQWLLFSYVKSGRDTSHYAPVLEMVFV